MGSIFSTPTIGTFSLCSKTFSGLAPAPRSVADTTTDSFLPDFPSYNYKNSRVGLQKISTPTLFGDFFFLSLLPQYLFPCFKTQRYFFSYPLEVKTPFSVRFTLPNTQLFSLLFLVWTLLGPEPNPPPEPSSLFSAN